MIINDSDIQYAENIFQVKFDEERRNAIKCLEYKDIVACPGSGKTTVLLAKLAILARGLPFDNNRAICVLTHTNVAIDEIKYHLGIKGNILFSYPNFFGTIQSFIDRYLVIPCYLHLSKKRPVRINNEIYYELVEKQRKYLGRDVNAWCHRSGRKNYPFSIRYSLKDFSICEGIEGKSLNLDIQNPSEKKIYDNLKRMKKYILYNGVLSYDDAYSLAYLYLRDFGLKLKNVFSKRFKFVFIDEMQDTAEHQINLLDKVFDENVIIQRIGDPNQAIFSSTSKIKENPDWCIKDNPLEINGSKRFSELIAQKVKNVCIHQQDIEGNSEIQNIKPIIITYENENIDKVSPTFADIIKEHHLIDNPYKFKAIGFIGKPNDKDRITIKSYWNNFSKIRLKKKQEFNCLAGYLQKASDEIIKIDGVNFYYSSIIRLLIKILREAEITDDDEKYYSRSSFLKYLKENHKKYYDSLMLNIAKWCKQLHTVNDINLIISDVKNHILNEFKDVFNFSVLGNVNEFIDANLDESLEEVESALKKDYFEMDGIKIYVDTVHSVKGETHTATLYLETFFRSYDIEKLVEYLKGNNPSLKQITINKFLKIAYVGMSRPTHLLCIACQKNSINGHEEELEKAGWKIIIL